LASLGVLLEQTRPGDEPAGVVKLKLQFGNLFMVIHHNFYVISRYNHSLLYSMVINDLAEMIRRQYYR
jgi:membrane-bound lytic murein transglycosylase B